MFGGLKRFVRRAKHIIKKAAPVATAFFPAFKTAGIIGRVAKAAAKAKQMSNLWGKVKTGAQTGLMTSTVPTGTASASAAQAAPVIANEQKVLGTSVSKAKSVSRRSSKNKYVSD